MATLKYDANSSFQTGTLGSSYTSGGGTLTLTGGHGARFPSSGDFWVRVDDEIFKVTSRSTDALTVTGAQDSTSASNHSSGATVTWVLGVAALTQLRADLLSSGVGASNSLYDTYATIVATTPAVGDAGKLAFCTDSFYSARWSGSAWEWFYLNIPVTIPPTSSWTWDNQGGASETQSGGYLYLNAPAVSGANQRIRYRTVSAPYTLVAAIIPNVNHISNQMAGLVIRASDGKNYNFGPSATSSSQQRASVVKNNSSTSWSSTPLTLSGPSTTNMTWLKIVDNNTNIIMSYSSDGYNFTDVYTEARTAFLTPAQIGYFAETQSTTLLASVTLVSWKVT